ncbi:hypothetical protein GALL_418650 [mine drainage metagenome]|uniref:Uncharacterized protein n=1 Tax=mine drainage metagenome TaxID=410659 RepID=A0A1J5PZP6_9ZZZZ
MRTLARDRSGQEAEAQAAGDEFDDEVDLARARHHVGLETGAAAGVEHQRIQREALAEQDQRQPGEFGRRHRIAPRQRVVGGDQQLDALALHDLPVERVGHRQQRRGQLDLAAEHLLLEALAALLDQADLDAWPASAVIGEHRREQLAGADRRQSQAQHAAAQPAQFGELGEQVVALGQHRLRAAQHDLAGRGRLDARRIAIEQRHADLVLELTHRLADRRLGDEHGARGAREAALADDFDEHAQGTQIHRHSFLEFPSVE